MEDKMSVAAQNGRKHVLESEFYTRRAKRVRLDSMLERLSLDSEPRTKPCQYDVNPLVGSESLPKKRKLQGINGVISEKMFESYKKKVFQGLALIKYSHPFTILIVHFQRWVKRLFNVFVQKFNDASPHKRVRKVRTYSKILAMTEDPSINFSYLNLLEIVMKENLLEQRSLSMKRDDVRHSKKLQEIREEEDLAKECNYKYWVRMSNLPVDVDMEDILLSEASDMEMDSETHDGNDVKNWNEAKWNEPKWNEPKNYSEPKSEGNWNGQRNYGANYGRPRARAFGNTEANYGNYYGTAHL